MTNDLIVIQKPPEQHLIAEADKRDRLIQLERAERAATRVRTKEEWREHDDWELRIYEARVVQSNVQPRHRLTGRFMPDASQEWDDDQYPGGEDAYLDALFEKFLAGDKLAVIWPDEERLRLAREAKRLSGMNRRRKKARRSARVNLWYSQPRICIICGASLLDHSKGPLPSVCQRPACRQADYRIKKKQRAALSAQETPS